MHHGRACADGRRIKGHGDAASAIHGDVAAERGGEVASRIAGETELRVRQCGNAGVLHAERLRGQRVAVIAEAADDAGAEAHEGIARISFARSTSIHQTQYRRGFEPSAGEVQNEVRFVGIIAHDVQLRTARAGTLWSENHDQRGAVIDLQRGRQRLTVVGVHGEGEVVGTRPINERLGDVESTVVRVPCHHLRRALASGGEEAAEAHRVARVHIAWSHPFGIGVLCCDRDVGC